MDRVVKRNAQKRIATRAWFLLGVCDHAAQVGKPDFASLILGQAVGARIREPKPECPLVIDWRANAASCSSVHETPALPCTAFARIPGISPVLPTQRSFDRRNVIEIKSMAANSRGPREPGIQTGAIGI
jgi:hypothetical protein